MHTPSESFTHNDSKSEKTSTPSHEIDGDQRLETLEFIQNQERVDSEKERSSSIESELSALKEATDFAERHDYFGFQNDKTNIVKLLMSEAQQYEGSGLSISDIMTDKKQFDKFQKGLKNELEADYGEESIKTDKTLQSRFQELQKSESSVAFILQTLKAEFSETMDKESSAVLDKYSTLLSPEIFSDKEELEAVETLFYTQSGTFTNESFSSFVQSVYDQPNDLISEESKIKIEKTFNIPRSLIKTGKELSQFTQLKHKDGSFVHKSAENALEFRSGVKTHMNKKGKAVLTLEGKSHSHPLILPAEILENGESIAEYANYALIQQTVYNELGQLTNLFGGGQEDETSLPDERTVEKANRFAQLLIGRKSPDAILSQDKLGNLCSALHALHDPSLIGESESLNTMIELGILQNADFQWERVSDIGLVLRQNQYYTTFEMEKEGAAHDLLSAEIGRIFPHGDIQKEKMSANRVSRHFSFIPNYALGLQINLKSKV